VGIGWRVKAFVLEGVSVFELGCDQRIASAWGAAAQPIAGKPAPTPIAVASGHL